MFNLIKTSICILLALTSSLGLAESIVHVQKGLTTPLGDKVEYFVDSSREMSINDVRSLPLEQWQSSSVETPNFGYTLDHHWFKFKLNHEGTEPLAALIAIDYPLLDHLEVFHYEGGTQKQTVTLGDLYPFHDRIIDHRNFLIPISLSNGTPSTIYIKMKTEGSAQLPIAIHDSREYFLADQDEQVIKSVYYGMMLVMALYNLFLYLSIREKPYLYYVGFISSIVFLMGSAHGYFFQYVVPNSPKIHELSLLITVPSSMLFACLFASSFLRLRETAPLLDKALRLLIYIFAASIIGAFVLPYSISTQLSVFLAIPTCILIVITGPYAWYKGQKSARYFTYAWALLLVGIFMGAASKFGFLPRNFFTEYGVNLGSVIEALLLSFALADRFNRERDARFKAQRERLEEAEHRQQAEEKLYYQATHQSTDGFPNMVMLQQVMQEMIDKKGPSKNQFSLVFFHLRNFHEINKTLGHANADLILNMFSRRFGRLTIDEDICQIIEDADGQKFYFSHIEGVIFAHILKTGNIKEAEMIVKGMRSSLMDPLEFNGMKLDLGLSSGIACFPAHGSDIATLVRHTRVATDAASNANNHLGIYSKDINPYSARRLTLMGELKKAIHEESLELYFQPLVDCQSQKVIGCEALLRWNHESLGYIPPDEFISMAEKTGIIRPLTYWVLDHSFSELAVLLKTDSSLLMSVNISAMNLQEKDFATRIETLIENHQIPSENVVLEVTETSVMSNPDSAIAMLNSLARNKVKIAIDDFGTGHSSLSYIRKLPVYEVKIDRSFVSALDQSKDEEVITRAALNLSHDLGYKVVAEGVESQPVSSVLQAMGCDYMQGYYIAKPMPASDFHDWLQDHQNQLTNTTSAG